MIDLPDLKASLEASIRLALIDLYGPEAGGLPISLQNTRKEFVGDYTLVTFPFVGLAKSSPEAVANAIGLHLREQKTS